MIESEPKACFMEVYCIGFSASLPHNFLIYFDLNYFQDKKRGNSTKTGFPTATAIKIWTMADN